MNNDINNNQTESAPRILTDPINKTNDIPPFLATVVNSDPQSHKNQKTKYYITLILLSILTFIISPILGLIVGMVLNGGQEGWGIFMLLPFLMIIGYAIFPSINAIITNQIVKGYKKLITTILISYLVMIAIVSVSFVINVLVPSFSSLIKDKFVTQQTVGEKNYDFSKDNIISKNNSAIFELGKTNNNIYWIEDPIERNDLFSPSYKLFNFKYNTVNKTSSIKQISEFKIEKLNYRDYLADDNNIYWIDNFVLYKYDIASSSKTKVTEHVARLSAAHQGKYLVSKSVNDNSVTDETQGLYLYDEEDKSMTDLLKLNIVGVGSEPTFGGSAEMKSSGKNACYRDNNDNVGVYNLSTKENKMIFKGIPNKRSTIVSCTDDYVAITIGNTSLKIYNISTNKEVYSYPYAVSYDCSANIINDYAYILLNDSKSSASLEIIKINLLENKSSLAKINSENKNISEWTTDGANIFYVLDSEDMSDYSNTLTMAPLNFGTETTVNSKASSAQTTIQKLGLSFSTPDDYVVIENLKDYSIDRSDAILIVNKESVEGYIKNCTGDHCAPGIDANGLMIYKDQLNNRTPDQYMLDFSGSLGYSTTDVSVGDHQGYKLIFNCDGIGCGIPNWIVFIGNEVYIFKTGIIYYDQFSSIINSVIFTE